MINQSVLFSFAERSKGFDMDTEKTRSECNEAIKHAAGNEQINKKGKEANEPASQPEHQLEHKMKKEQPFSSMGCCYRVRTWRPIPPHGILHQMGSSMAQS